MTEDVQRTKPDLRGLLPAELADYVKSLGQPAYRAKQLFRQVQKHGAPDFAHMSDLPLAFRHYLGETATLTTPK